MGFEDFAKHLLERMGYQSRLTRRNEPSVDLIAHKDQLGIEPPIIKVQVKSGDGVVSTRSRPHSNCFNAVLKRLVAVRANQLS